MIVIKLSDILIYSTYRTGMMRRLRYFPAVYDRFIKQD